MKFRFKPEDLIIEDIECPSDRMRECLANNCNQLLEAHLKTLPKVYAQIIQSADGPWVTSQWCYTKDWRHNNQALLFDVQPIEELKEEE